MMFRRDKRDDRVVADTNVFISALMFGGVPWSFLDLVFLVRSCWSLPRLLTNSKKTPTQVQSVTRDVDLIRTRLQINALVVSRDCSPIS